MAARAVFIVYQFHLLSDFSFAGFLSVYKFGFRLDISTACYITLISLMLWIGNALFSHRVWSKTYKIWIRFALSVYLLISTSDAIVYSHWFTKLNPTALSFTSHPHEVFASISKEDHLLVMLFVLLFLFVSFHWVHTKWDDFFKKQTHLLYWKTRVRDLAVSFATGLLLIIGIRGGWQLEPINQSSAYFSNTILYNHIAINATWNLLNKVVTGNNKSNQYKIGSNEEVENAIENFYQKKTPELSLCKVRNPNLLFIVLEGFTADVIPAFGGESGLTPTIDSLIPQSIYWTNFYGNGDRTYKGLPAILNGEPSQPIGSIIQDNDKTSHLPAISKAIKNRGYRSSFYYGGESEFANIKSYLINTGYDKIVDINDFPTSFQGKKWGVPDHYVLEKLSKDLNQFPPPFFSIVLTLSTHEPYDIPVPPKIKTDSPADKFRSTVMYTDESLGHFISGIQKQAWYDSSLVVITADHGNPLPKDYTTNYEPGRFKIPLLIFGPALQDSLKGMKMEQVHSQNDLSYSILHALGIEFENRFAQELFSKDNDSKAFYTFDNGFGMVTNKGAMCYDYNANKPILNTLGLCDSLLYMGKLIMQGTQGR